MTNFEYVKQLTRSSASIGANYIEANEALGKKDFVMRLRISRKEAKETGYWLEIIDVGNDSMLEEERNKLIKETREFVLIFSAMIRNTK